MPRARAARLGRHGVARTAKGRLMSLILTVIHPHISLPLPVFSPASLISSSSSGNGSISFQELSVVLLALDADATDEDTKNMISEADVNGNNTAGNLLL